MKPEVTVAAVTERDGRFLMIEEISSGRLVINQPAGHLEIGETLVEAVVRETREETAWGFIPESIIGLYLWQHPRKQKSFLRVAFAGHCTDHDAGQPLDDGIQRAMWLGRRELRAISERLRSPMVMRCIDDYRKGLRYPLTLVSEFDLPDALEQAIAL